MGGRALQQLRNKRDKQCVIWYLHILIISLHLNFHSNTPPKHLACYETQPRGCPPKRGTRGGGINRGARPWQDEANQQATQQPGELTQPVAPQISSMPTATLATPPLRGAVAVPSRRRRNRRNSSLGRRTPKATSVRNKRLAKFEEARKLRVLSASISIYLSI